MVSLFIFTSCGQKPIDKSMPIDLQNPEIDKEAEAYALNIVKGYFTEEIENRVFEISEPVEIEGGMCAQIRVSGVYENGKYPIDIFAIDPATKETFFYSKTEDKFIKYVNVPYYACATSPDKSKRIESLGMYMDGPSGLHSLSTMRIIDMDTAEQLWVSNSLLNNSFLWSDNSKFVSFVRYTRVSAEAAVVNTEGYSLIGLPFIDDLVALDGQNMPDEMRPDPFFVPIGWVTGTELEVGFEWATIDGGFASGSYIYDVSKKELKNVLMADG
jgi:hypothetical protein